MLLTIYNAVTGVILKQKNVLFFLGTAAYDSNSEFDLQQYSLSEASVELKRWDYSNSDHSIQSLKSIASLESQCEDDTLEFMRRYVDILFDNSAQLTLELKSEFGLKSRVNNAKFSARNMMHNIFTY